MNLAKTAEPIEVRFGIWARVGPSNHVLDGGRDSPRGMGNLGGWANMGMPAVGLQRRLDLATEMGTLWKGSGTCESARRGLVLSHEDYF